ncbi:hypothetical protein CERSUDRAFT_104291, partial [Gelatoporia subvermispora B]
MDAYLKTRATGGLLSRAAPVLLVLSSIRILLKYRCRPSKLHLRSTEPAMPLQSTTCGQSPTSADLIIRSCDGVEFCVHKAILSLASQTFAAMFHGTCMAIDGQDPLILEEDAHTLEMLFRTCYPVLNPELKSTEDVLNLMKASKKYMADYAEQVARMALMSSDLLESAPFSVFSIACYFGLEEEARKAAKYTLKCHPPMTIPTALGSAGGINVWNLLAYGRTCKGAILASLEDDDDGFWNEVQEFTKFICMTCNPDAMEPHGVRDDSMLRTCMSLRLYKR